ncbi:MAG: ribosome silencing factor [Thermodesulfobacteriota bacterium]
MSGRTGFTDKPRQGLKKTTGEETKLDPKKKALEIARLALDKQAGKVLIINIGKLSSVTDYLVVCSADSERQVQAIARNIEDSLRAKKIKPIGTEGLQSGRWVLLDYVDVVAHVFLDHVRSYYDIEGLWAEATVDEIKDRPGKAKKPSAKGDE